MFLWRGKAAGVRAAPLYAVHHNNAPGNSTQELAEQAGLFHPGASMRFARPVWMGFRGRADREGEGVSACVGARRPAYEFGESSLVARIVLYDCGGIILA